MFGIGDSEILILIAVAVILIIILAILIIVLIIKKIKKTDSEINVMANFKNNIINSKDSSPINFCPSCGQKNAGDAKFCTKCGKQIISNVTAQSPSPSAIPTSPAPEGSAQKSSGIVTAMSVVGLVFGLIGMMGSFIPIIGIFAIKICVGAAIISGLSLVVAFAQNAKRTFPIVALTLSLIGVAIWYVQINKIESAARSARQLAAEMTQPTPSQTIPKQSSQQRHMQSVTTDRKGSLELLRYIGSWEYDDTKRMGQNMYIKISKDKSGRFKFERGMIYQGNILWVAPYLINSDGIYLKPSKGKLMGEFVSTNFYATHAEPFAYKITLDIKSANKLNYSVFSSIRGETDKYEATKISD